MERIYTTPLLDKLGVRPGSRIAIVGVDDPSFRAEIATRTGDLIEGPTEQPRDLVFLAADSQADLAPLPALRETVHPDGAIWVVSRKGRAATLRDVEVMAAAKAAGLVDNKVVAFSATHTALRLVVPRARR